GANGVARGVRVGPRGVGARGRGERPLAANLAPPAWQRDSPRARRVADRDRAPGVRGRLGRGRDARAAEVEGEAVRRPGGGSPGPWRGGSAVSKSVLDMQVFTCIMNTGGSSDGQGLQGAFGPRPEEASRSALRGARAHARPALQAEGDEPAG